MSLMSCRVSLESLSSRVSNKARYGDCPGFTALWRLGTNNMKLHLMFWNRQGNVRVYDLFKYLNTSIRSILLKCIKHKSSVAITYLQNALWSQVLKFPRSTAQAVPKSKETQIPNSSPILNKEKEEKKNYTYTINKKRERTKDFIFSQLK